MKPDMTKLAGNTSASADVAAKGSSFLEPGKMGLVIATIIAIGAVAFFLTR